MQSTFDITLVGEVNLDLVMDGLPAAMPVERELLASGFSMTLGSSSAILAHNMAMLGCSVGFQGQVGRDAMGALAVDSLRQAGVNVDKVVVATDGSGTGVTVLLPHGRERHILTYLGAMATLTPDALDHNALLSARHFHCSSPFLQQGLRPHLESLFRSLREAGLTISLDTNDDPEDRWAGIEELLPLIDILLPNEREACRMTGRAQITDAVDRLAAIVPLVAVKCGQHGAIVAQGAMRTDVPGISVSPVDTIGAGDSFNAGFLTAFLCGRDAVACAVAGNVCGALSTLRTGGTDAFRDHDLRHGFLQDHGHAWLQAGLRQRAECSA